MIQVCNKPEDKEYISDALQNSLEDIVHRLELTESLGILHPNFQPIELPEELTDRFQKLPLSLQHKYLLGQLQFFLYGIYYNGSLLESLAISADTDTLSLQQDFENSTYLGIDLAYFERLHAGNQGVGYFDPGWNVLRREDDDSLAVSKGGLTLHLTAHLDKTERTYGHLPATQQRAEPGDQVSIRLPKNRIQNGFYMAVGNCGPNNHQRVTHEVVRVYFHLTADGAVEVMTQLTAMLNEHSVPFSFKVLYNPSSYTRFDSGVLYVDKQDFRQVYPVLQTLYNSARSHFRPEVPLFTRCLAPGLGIAEEPQVKFGSQDSFGTNRCQMVARGLLNAHLAGDRSPEGRMDQIIDQFSTYGVSLDRPYLNPDSEDIYTPLKIA